MKTIKNSKEVTILEVGDKVLFGDLEYEVHHKDGYFLGTKGDHNARIFTNLNIDTVDFVNNLGITTLSKYWIFPEVKSLEALTAIVSALFKEYEKQNELPKTWEEFCKKNPVKKEECWIECLNGKILRLVDLGSKGTYRSPQMDKHLCTSKQEAEAFLALMQLRQLRKCYIGDWESDWTNSEVLKYGITCIGGILSIVSTGTIHRVMSFPTKELAEQFLTNFKDLLEIAKLLL